MMVAVSPSGPVIRYRFTFGIPTTSFVKPSRLYYRTSGRTATPQTVQKLTSLNWKKILKNINQEELQKAIQMASKIFA